MTGRERLARWAGIVDNRRGSPMRSNKQMQDEMTGRETLEPELEPEMMGSEVEPGREIIETSPTHAELEQVKGERDQLLDRLARLQAEFDNARKRELKERADSRDYAVANTVDPFLSVMDNFQLA